MAKTVRSIKLSQWIKEFERIAPAEWALSWDSVGLQVGNPNRKIRKVAVALEATGETVRIAVKKRADLLVIHHPLIWKPLNKITEDSPTARVISRCIENHLAVYCAHTSWDLCLYSMTGHIGRLLGLQDLHPLEAKPLAAGYKLVVFVPESHLQSVRKAMAKAGGGQIDNYTECSFSTLGTGTFFGQEGTKPSLGKPCQLEQIQEHRLEMMVPRSRIGAVIKAMTDVHPYEEVAYDLFATEECLKERHCLWTGRFPRPLRVPQLARRIRKALACNRVDFIGDPSKPVQSIALCSGGGKSLFQEIRMLPVDAYLTGDIDYHAAREAQALGLRVFDAGHFGTEKFFPQLVLDTVRSLSPLKSIPCVAILTETDPVHSFI